MSNFFTIRVAGNIHKLLAMLWIETIVEAVLGADQGKLSRGAARCEIVFDDLIQKNESGSTAIKMPFGLINQHSCVFICGCFLR